MTAPGSRCKAPTRPADGRRPEDPAPALRHSARATAGRRAARHAGGARRPAAQRLGRELRSDLHDEQLRAARCCVRGTAFRERGRGFHLLALHKPDRHDVRAPAGCAWKACRSLHRDRERHERHPAMLAMGAAEGGRPRGVLAAACSARPSCCSAASSPSSASSRPSCRRPIVQAWKARDQARTRNCCSWRSPSNPLTEVCDLRALADDRPTRPARWLAVDNCFCSPALQRPVEFGADLIVIHSGTKYLDGQGRVMAGALVCAVAGADRHERFVPVMRTAWA